MVYSHSVLAQTEGNQLAFLSDIHLQEVYADLNSEEFKGVFNPTSGKFATIRTMKSQLNSTRLFNEKSRFIPSDWPEDLALLLQTLTYEELKRWGKMDENEGELFLKEKTKKLKASIHESR